jgi:CBS domain containing-hemolysin-like protein
VAHLLEGPLSGFTERSATSSHSPSAFIIITALHIVLGEQAPKLMGLARAERVALAVALPMQLFYRIASLPIRALDWASARTVSLVGIQATSKHAQSTRKKS